MNLRPYPLSQIASWLNVKGGGVLPDRTIDTLAYDTRKLNRGKGTLFFALQAQRDGHAFIPRAYQAGVRDFVVQKGYVIPEAFSDALFLHVEDTLNALQTLAFRHRQQYKGKVLAITGSNGKTVVKEWLYQLLSPDMEIIRSPKSYNSQVGVALSLWELDNRAPLAIIEAGISQPGEMEKLEQMIRPDYGILTNVKQAHFQNFSAVSALASEKLILFKRVERLVYNPIYAPKYDPKHISRVFTWGKLHDPFLNKLEIWVIEPWGNSGTRISGAYGGTAHSIEIPFSDAASIENAQICWSFLLQMGYDQEVIQERMRSLSPLQMRLELKEGIFHSSIIDDSYSFDVSSLGIALDFLYQQGQHARQVVILSDLPYRGSREAELYRAVADLMHQKPMYKLIGIGERIHAFREYFAPIDCAFFASTSEFIDQFAFKELQGCTLLVKGARAFKFEKIIRQLELKTHETHLEIDLNALSHNLKQYKALLRGTTRIMGMVKAFSYGSGSFEIAGQLQYDQIDYLAVAYTDEGVRLRENGIRIPIMVMNPDRNYFQAMVHHKLEPEIYTYDLLEALLQYCARHKIKDFPIHIKLETGMNRLGFTGSELPKLLNRLQHQDALKVISVFSHLAAAGDPAQDDFTGQQLARLNSGGDFLQAGLGYSFLRHIANSAGTIRFPEMHMDMVRPGIGLYGITQGDTPLSLQPVLSLKTRVAQIKQVRAEDTIGYDRKGRLLEGGSLAIVKIGYADGYDRRLGNGVGHMRIGSHLVPTVGEICMDMCMLDVSGLPVKEGDEVIVFGSDPEVGKLAKAADMIPYELLTGISQRVKRIYYYG